MKAFPAFYYQKRPTREVSVGQVTIGGGYPLCIQSMITAGTMDTEASVREAMELAAAGSQIVRITAPTVREAHNLRSIKSKLLTRGCTIPLVADIHFKPGAALEAAKWVEKVRINPGNYADSKKFSVREYTNEEYRMELVRVGQLFEPLVAFCKARGIAMRIGVNHGSLSDRIMSRYGDTPLGMVESAMEFANIARGLGYHNFVFSMKASSPRMMIAANRLLVTRLSAVGLDYPLHLGVTEAGDGEDGRIKSAIGIGSLLYDGIGDTVRVSLTEDSVHEIHFAKALVNPFLSKKDEVSSLGDFPPSFDYFSYCRRAAHRIFVHGVPVGGEEPIRVFTSEGKWNVLRERLPQMGEYQPEIVLGNSGIIKSVDPRDQRAIEALCEETAPRLVTVADGIDLSPIRAFRLLAARIPAYHPILLKDTLFPALVKRDPLSSLLEASIHIGSLVCDGIGNAILVQGEQESEQSVRLAYNILQASGARVFKTDYVACPSCGRTLFNLQQITSHVKAATSHLKGVRIAIMGCIVNGPGEMADADFGYVGGAPGKVNLYVGKTPVKFNIPEKEAVSCLVDLIRKHGKWVEPSS
ncbi:4-hydroxy-3-methylbut-2-en-1-yl diphosphate synthase [Candidatus Xiphinematobacter sp. Idaho Grape]|uniref:(E)-4-hydroxy-3-methylbut-2-enyl-diphosphate synthase n=1 Tax=Candidatus Xiphinematobacter sp. Idaho Grape TaxID=1704307 RepID=UPI0007069C41|nr:(E)-4-hydroxy-3-methylbut-2-enyl-diphosphate synthase [Candidatus Xiphinematobacter sp. Idaho Grape]ALJ56546.1 4-hydroxy-3-methylbut-2-en-1-yl diphosphate synthase [Candidatus Xiphinematobacter sp. Idaho Grape]